MVHERGAQLLGVLIDVVGEALRDREPDDVRGEHQRVVPVERRVHGLGQHILLRERGDRPARRRRHGLNVAELWECVG